MEVIAKRPTQCSHVELEDFASFVRAGGEVVSEGLERRVRGAEYLLFLMDAECLKGIGAVKRPETGYRKGVSAKAGVILRQSAFPFELGWVFVLRSARGGRGKMLVTTAFKQINGKGIFATSRTDNKPMRECLLGQGFAIKGKAYASQRGHYKLQLFTRHAAQPSAPADAPRPTGSGRG